MSLAGDASAEYHATSSIALGREHRVNEPGGVQKGVPLSDLFAFFKAQPTP